MTICVDFDGTVVKHKYPRIGEDVPGAVETLRQLVADGHNIIIFTMRSGKELADAVKWYEDREIPVYGINTNPTQKNWTQSPKAYGQLYIDDAAYGCPLIFERDQTGKIKDRPYVDWSQVLASVKQPYFP